MKAFRKNRIFQIIYPLLLYYLIYSLSNGVFLILFQKQTGKLFCLMLAAAVTIPFLLYEYKRLPIVRMDEFKKEELLSNVILVGLIVLFGILLNVFVAHLPLSDISKGFEKANETLGDGSVVIQILSNALLIPILEELLYRGIICGQLSLWYKPWIGILISSVLFGIMHFNVIQFLYAVIMGILLGFSYVKTKNIFIPILGHGLTNLVVILYFM